MANFMDELNKALENITDLVNNEVSRIANENKAKTATIQQLGKEIAENVDRANDIRDAFDDFGERCSSMAFDIDEQVAPSMAVIENLVKLDDIYEQDEDEDDNDEDEDELMICAECGRVISPDEEDYIVDEDEYFCDRQCHQAWLDDSEYVEEVVYCDNCGKEIEDDIVPDLEGNFFCCEECKKKFAEDDEE